jgi:hypothetical protein
MADWRPAKSIVVLLDNVNDLWPNRSTASDGIKGDPAHANRDSEHNPNGAGVVTAVDITHDPSGGPDGDDLVKALLEIVETHPAPWYIVWNRHIWSRTDGWVRQNYTGENPHTNHVHISMMQTRSRYDSTRPWNLEDHMPLSAADLAKIRQIVKDEVLSKDVQNLGTDEPKDTTTPRLILERDHRRITQMHNVIVRGQTAASQGATP